MKSVYEIKLSGILPQNILADEKMMVAAEALDVELKALSYDAWQVLHLPRLNELPHKVLDHFAFHFHVDHYEPSTMELDIKRNLIRESIAWHKVKGTPASLERYLGYFGIGAQVIENWEYGGEPYYFKLKLKDIAYLDDDGDTFMRLVYTAKNERSWLDAFIFDLQRVDDNLKVGQPELTANVEEVAGANVANGRNELAMGLSAVSCSVEEVGADFSKFSAENLLRIGIKIGEGGTEEYHAEPVSEEEGDYWEWIWQNWLRWKKNAIVKKYKHHFDDEEIDPNEPEEYPEGDFLRLYFAFPYTKRLRYVTMLNPRDGIQGSDVKDLSEYTAKNQLLMNWRRTTTQGIVRALIITKKEERIL